ncbi:DUF1385 domain-containing protein [Kosmotoga pacifica]|uniref:Metal-dependent enzyme n=1 Tax=Kosmotoga pacifica TaxID=1330330 RepID=A0A0G2Z5I5_9BACT|nr:DUF1385 domain-containing protein [Kosmotoga pacifica]AKI96880.1 metal-dependent enzyme [Kosmotoga pacifica]
MKKLNVGGQAVIEGVMMKGKRTVVAVRGRDGKIITKEIEGAVKNPALFSVVFLRGLLALYEALVIGTRALGFSAEVTGEGEMTKKDIFLTFIVAFAVAIGMFALGPLFLAQLLVSKSNPGMFALVEGLIRAAFFITYVWVISLFKDIQRVFEYHGAEHKAVYTYENNEELTIENARKYTTLHPRCGTSFLILTLFFAIIVFALLGYWKDMDLIWKIMSRIVFIPIIAALTYEFQRLTAKIVNTKIGKILASPGLLFQKITTKEPSDDELEVALVALKESLRD